MTELSQPDSSSSDNAGLVGTIRAGLSTSLANGALFVAAALIMAVVFPGLIGPLALILALATWIVNWRGVSELPVAFGPVGWLLLGLLIWVSASVSWSIAPGLSVDRTVRLVLVVLIAFPAILLAARSKVAIPPHDAVVLIIVAMAGVLIFEAASGGLLQSMLPGGSDGFQVLFTVMTVLMWPVVALLATHYGKREAALWILVGVGSIVVGGATELRVAIGFCLALFLIGLMSKWAVRILLWLAIIFGSLSAPVILTFAGEYLTDWAGALNEVAPELPVQIEFWRLAVERWAGSPIFGTGIGTGISVPGWSVLQDIRGGFGGSFIHVLVGIGGVGFILTLVLLLLIVHRVIVGDNTGWRLASVSALVGAALSLPVPGDGIWQSWWLGTLIISAIAFVTCREPAPASAALGSIFDGLDDDPDSESEKEDDGLYHFDNGDDDDYYEEDPDEWDVDDEEDDDEGDREDGDEEEARYDDEDDPSVNPSERR